MKPNPHRVSNPQGNGVRAPGSTSRIRLFCFPGCRTPGDTKRLDCAGAEAKQLRYIDKAAQSASRKGPARTGKPIEAAGIRNCTRKKNCAAKVMPRRRKVRG